MITLKNGNKVVYTGISNKWTFNKDLEQYSQGRVENVILSNSVVRYSVCFENGLIATIDSCDLILKCF